MAINCLIIDDEPSSQTVLKAFIADVAFLNLVNVCNNALEAMTILNQGQTIDLLFLDINMPKVTGLEFYKSLKNPPDVIFTTAYSEYALDGFEVNAIDYLLKPFSFDRFLKAVNKVVDKQAVKNDPTDAFINIKSNKVLHRIRLDDINYIEAYGDYVKVHLADTFILTNSTFSKFLEQLPETFLRCHKSFAVNSLKVSKISGNTAHLNDHVIPIGQTYKDTFLKSLN